jgi:chemosensory pili system protein ChpA (sensor histidine kinase/response regulator)
LYALKVDGCWGHQDAIIQKLEGDILLPNIFADLVIVGSGQTIPVLNCREVDTQELREGSSQAASPVHNSDRHSHFPTEASPSHLQVKDETINSLTSLSDFFGNNVEQIGEQTGGKPPKDPSQPVKVLIVESSANVRRYLAMTLNKSGFVTEQSQDGAEAIALLKSRQESGLDIDVVITDLEMPQMNGFKFLSNVRAEPSFQSLPIIVLTARNNENDQKLALDLGATAYFSKPYREQELIATLRQLVQGA